MLATVLLRCFSIGMNISGCTCFSAPCWDNETLVSLSGQADMQHCTLPAPLLLAGTAASLLVPGNFQAQLTSGEAAKINVLLKPCVFV